LIGSSVAMRSTLNHHTPNKHATPSKVVEMSPLDRLKSVKGEAH